MARRGRAPVDAIAHCDLLRGATMTPTRDRGRDSGDRATPSTTNTRNRTTRSGKPAILLLTAWSLLPVRLAERPIRCGGLRDA